MGDGATERAEHVHGHGLNTMRGARVVVTPPDTARRTVIGDGWSLRPLAGTSGEPLGARRTAARGYAASCDGTDRSGGGGGGEDGGGGAELLVHVQAVPHHPVRACYPFGAHDVVVWLGDGDDETDHDDGETDHSDDKNHDGDVETGHGDRGARAARVPEEAGADLLRVLVPALFAADARCRRVVAAPDEYDGHTQRVLVAGGFRRITEADLPHGSVVLFAAEPPEIAGLSTALDDMPH
ncbi:hypothetical protein SsS58_05662 [Streptomyces scabiei]|uniref:Uncharacterized protein n=1 Tax=Streptomyces scabiei TaxID=1930 RepID=A0A117EF98_STRSC|nr:hypothetical protein SsS58_05662 [Streptomyces scabiei]